MDELESMQTTLELDEKLSNDIRYADDTTLFSVIFNKYQPANWKLPVQNGSIQPNAKLYPLIQITSILNVDKVKEFVLLVSILP